MSDGKPGIFCLEGEWADNFTDRKGVEPLLQVMESMGWWGRMIHRDVATRSDLEHYATQWTLRKYDRYRLGYFAFHGDPGCIQLGRETVTLDELAETLRGRAGGRIIYFGACKTMATADEDLQRFCGTTGVKAIVGYTRYIDWMESAAFDLLLLPELLDSERMPDLYDRLNAGHPQFARRLGFRIATARWTSPRKIALDAAK